MLQQAENYKERILLAHTPAASEPDKFQGLGGYGILA